MRVLAGKGGLVPGKPRRRSKYDFALSGQLVEIKLSDVGWCRELEVARRYIRRRAWVRGLRLYWQWLEDGTLAVRAEPRRAQAAPERAQELRDNA